MLFIYPMWDHESQRIGKQKCTPLGYKLHGIAELLGFLGLFIFIIVCIYLWFRHGLGVFDKRQFWWMAIPFGIGLVAEFLYAYSWRLATRKGFHYNYDTCEASWMEDGKRLTFKWKSGQSPDANPVDIP